MNRNQLAKHDRIASTIYPVSVTDTADSITYLYAENDYQFERRISKIDGLITDKRIRTANNIHGNPYIKLENFRMVFDSVDTAFAKRIITFDEQGILYAAIGRITEWQSNFVRNDNGSKMSLRQFAKYLGKESKWINKHLHSLESKGFLRIIKESASNSIEISPHVAWRGNAKNMISFSDKLSNDSVSVGSPEESDINTNIAEVITDTQNAPQRSTTDYRVSSPILHSRLEYDIGNDSVCIPVTHPEDWKMVYTIGAMYRENIRTGERIRIN